MSESYSVLIIEMSRYMDEEGEREVRGFATWELAREFAQRWVRDSLEEQRRPGQSCEQLRKMWLMFGDDAVVIGGASYAASDELDYFIANPATREERDWQSIKERAGIK